MGPAGVGGRARASPRLQQHGDLRGGPLLVARLRKDPSRYWPREWWPDDWRDRASFQADLALTALYLAAAVLTYSRWIGEDASEVAVVVFLVGANLTTLTAFFPLIRGVIEDPSHERTAPWAVWASAYALLGVTTYAIQGEIWSELMLYPVLNTVLHGVGGGAVAAVPARAARPAPAGAGPGGRGRAGALGLPRDSGRGGGGARRRAPLLAPPRGAPRRRGRRS